jgi:transcriptional regulator with XRE-family HTH domain
MTSTDPDHQELERLGGSIRQIRIEKRLSVSQVAAGARMDEASIAELEAGQFDPPYDLLVDIARGLGVQPSTIITRTEQTTGEGEGR